MLGCCMSRRSKMRNSLALKPLKSQGTISFEHSKSKGSKYLSLVRSDEMASLEHKALPDSYGAS
jgi:hypothetical protein